jgi:hypothetical protein
MAHAVGLLVDRLLHASEQLLQFSHIEVSVVLDGHQAAERRPAGRRHVTGRLDPAINGNFNSRDHPYISLALIQE